MSRDRALSSTIATYVVIAAAGCGEDGNGPAAVAANSPSTTTEPTVSSPAVPTPQPSVSPSSMTTSNTITSSSTTSQTTNSSSSGASTGTASGTTQSDSSQLEPTGSTNDESSHTASSVSSTSDGTSVSDTEGTSSQPEDSQPGDTFGPDSEEACTTFQRVNNNTSGSGPYAIVIETNSAAGINEGTIYRPAELGGDELFPLFVWGEGGCARKGLDNVQAMAEIASHGYVVIADGTPNGGDPNREMNADDVVGMGRPLVRYIDWALKENVKTCSAYYHSIDATKVASNGFSCGGLMSMGTAADPRITTWGVNSSGLFGVNQPFYDSVHTPVLVVVGNDTDQAKPNGRRDYDNLSAAGIPIMYFEDKTTGHGGDLFEPRGGDFTKINLAWLNWWLKGDQGATGKGLLVGGGCPYCTDNNWVVMSANLP